MGHINCNPHSQATQLTTIKMRIYQVRYTCYLYFIFFSIYSSEARKKSWILSVKHASNTFCTWQNAFSMPRVGSSLWFKRRCSLFFFFFLPFEAINCISVFAFAIVLLFSAWAEVSIAKY